MSKGLILGNTASQDGGAIVSNGTFIANDGEITGNTAGKNGGAICLNGGSADISGILQIFNNTATASGGAIYNQSATLTISGGEIYENSANQKAGAVYLAENATLTMLGGEIYSNTALQGGAIYSLATGTITSGKTRFIDSEKAYAEYEIASSALVISGGYIYNNTTMTDGLGGAIFIEDTSSKISTLLITGGEIYNNTANKHGGAVYVLGNGFVQVSGGKIYQNKAENADGGAFYLAGSNLLVKGGEIYENESFNYAGAIFASKNNTLTEDNDSYLVILGGTITNNITGANQLSGAVHVSTGSEIIAGRDAYVYNNKNKENKDSNVYLTKNTIIKFATNASDNFVLGVDTSVDASNYDSTDKCIALSFDTNYQLTNNFIKGKFIPDNADKYVYLQDNKVLLGSDKLQSVQYVAEDYIGDYDGASHSIKFEVLSNPNNAKIEFVAVAKLEDINGISESNWSETNPSFREGIKRYVYYRITENGSSKKGYRVLNIRNIIPTITELPRVEGKPTVNTIYSKTAGAGGTDNRPLLTGGKAEYNGRVIEGDFIWSYEEFSFTNVGEQVAYVTFDPYGDSYSNVDFTIMVNVYTDKLYYGTSASGVTGFYLDSNFTQASDTITMQQAINSLPNNGYVYMFATYVVDSASGSQYLYLQTDTVNIQRGQGFKDYLFRVDNGTNLVIGKDESGKVMSGRINVDGGALWKTASGGNTAPANSNYYQNQGISAEKPLIGVSANASLSVYGSVQLRNNETLSEGQSGGAIFTLGNVTLNGTSIYRNMALHGAGISVGAGALLTIEDATFDGNATFKAGAIPGFAGGNGGAIYVNGGTTGAGVLINKVSISTNKATANGGAIYVNGGTLQLDPQNTDDILISYNRTVLNGTIYISNENPSAIVISGCRIEDNNIGEEGSSTIDANVADAIYYASYNDESSFTFDKSSSGAEISIRGKIVLGENSKIIQKTALSSGASIQLKTVDSYEITRVVIEKVDYRGDVLSNYTLYDTNEGFYLTQINTHGGHDTVQLGNVFKLYVRYEWGSETLYAIDVNYGKTYEEYINDNVLQTSPVTAMEKIGYEVSMYCFNSENGAKANAVDLTKQVYYNSGVSTNGYNLYTVWTVSNPIIEIASNSETKKETYGTPIVLTADIKNKNTTDNFSYSYQWYYGDKPILDANEETYTIYNVEETGYYKVYVEVLSGSIIKSDYSQNVFFEIVPAQLNVVLANNNFTYTGKTIYAKYVNGVDGDTNLEIADGQLQYSDEVNDLGLTIATGTDQARNANVNNETFSMKISITNTNYALTNNELLWKISPLTLEIDYWYDVITKQKYTTAYEQDSSVNHILVPVYKNIYQGEGSEEADTIVSRVITRERKNGGSTVCYFYTYTNGFVQGLENTASATVTGYNVIDTYTATVTDISNTNYALPEGKATEFTWNITGSQAFISRWKVNERIYVHGDLEENNYTITKNYADLDYKISMIMEKSNKEIIKDSLKVKISVTGQTNAGLIVNDSVSFFTTFDEPNIDLSGYFLSLREAGSYKITVDIIEFEEVLSSDKNPANFDSYYVLNDNNEYVLASEDGGVYEENKTYYVKQSAYFKSPTANYTIDFIIEKETVELIWGIDDVETDTVTYDAKFHQVKVVRNDKGANISLSYVGEYNKLDAGSYKVTASLTQLSIHNYIIKEGSEVFNWTIEQAYLTITWPSKVVYEWNAEVQTFVPVIRGLIGKDSHGLSFANSSAHEIGKYTCEIITTQLNDNYTLGEQSLLQSWEITPRTLTFTWEIYKDGVKVGVIDLSGSSSTSVACNEEYIGKAIVLRPRINNFVSGFDSVNFEFNYNAADENFINAGNYVGMINLASGLTGSDKDKYQLLENNTTSQAWTITPKAVTFIWDYVQPFEYNSTDYSITASVNPDDIVNVNDLFEITYSTDPFVDGTGYYTNVASAVGIYRAKVSGIGNNNYTFVESNSTVTQLWEIAKRKLTFVWTGVGTDSMVYSGATKYYQVSSIANQLETEIGGITVDAVYKNSLGRSIDRESIIDVDTYTATATLTGTYAGNYVIEESSLTYSWTIVPKVIEFNWTGTDYDTWVNDSISVDVLSNRAQYFTFAPSNAYPRDTIYFDVSLNAKFTNGTAKATGLATPSYSGGNMSLTDYRAFFEANAKDCGSYDVTISNISGTKNYTIVNSTSLVKAWTIVPVQLNVTNIADVITVDYGNGVTVPFVYNALPQTVAVRVTNTYRVGEFLTAGTEYTLTNATQTNAGNYVVTINLNENGNYIFKTVFKDGSGNETIKTSYDCNLDWQISKLYVILAWNYEDDSFTNSNKYVGAVVTNIQGTDVVNVINYSTDLIPGIHDYSSKYYTNVAVNVGKYLAKASELSNNNYAIDENTATYEWNITPRKASIAWKGTNISGDSATYSKNEIYYSADIANLINSVSAKLKHSYFYSEDGLTWQALIDEHDCVNAGYYKCTLELEEGADYVLAEGTEKIWQINPKTLTFTWSFSTRVYNGETFRPTVSSISGRLAGDENSVNIGEYTGDLDKTEVNLNGSKYTTTIKSLTGSASNNYTLNGSVNTSWQWSILPINLEFNWSAGSVSSWVYNKTVKNYKPVVTTNYVGSQSVDFDFEITLQTPNGTVKTLNNLNSCIDAGSYTVTIKGLLGDYKNNYSLAGYDASYLTKTWTILQKEVTFVWQYTGGLQYNGEEQKVQADVQDFVVGDQVKVASDNGYIDNAKINVGNYIAKVRALDNENYTFNTRDTANNWFLNWTIIARRVEIFWQAENIEDSSENPVQEYTGSSISFIPTITNVLNGEGVGLSFTTSVNTSLTDSTINAGNYERIITGLYGSHGANYTIEGVTNLSKTWTISQIQLKFENGPAKPYNSQPQQLTVNLVPFNTTGVVEGDLLTVYPMYDGRVSYVQTSAGTYTPVITLGGAKANNYQLNYIDDVQNASLVISKVQITIPQWDTGTYVYNGENQYPTAQIEGIQGNDIPTKYVFEYTKGTSGSYQELGENSQSSQAGSYRISVRLTDTVNYEISGILSQEYVISSADLADYKIIALKTGAKRQDASSPADKTIVLIVLYGINGENASQPTGKVTLDYVTPDSSNVNQITADLTIVPAADAYSDIYNTYKSVIDLYLSGKYSYAIVSYEEYNENPYNPSFAFTPAINNTEIEGYNYKAISLTQLVQKFYPSNLNQGEVSLYYKQGSSYTKVTTGAQLTVTYGDKLTFFVIGGTSLKKDGNNDNNYSLIINSQQISVTGKYDFADIVYESNTSDAEITAFISSVTDSGKSVGIIKVTVQFTLASDSVVIGGYKAGGENDGQTYVEGFSSSISIKVDKKGIAIIVPNATMTYGTDIIVKDADSDFVLSEEDIVFASDREDILNSLVLRSLENYTTYQAGVYAKNVTVTFTNKNYTTKPSGITYGDLTVSGQVLTNDTEGITITANDANCIYDGTGQRPTGISAQYKTITLTYDTTKVVYSNNIDAGTNTASFIITLTGNYQGTLIGYYSIKKLSIADAIFDAKLLESQEYTSQAISKEFSYAEGMETRSRVTTKTGTGLFINKDFEVYYSSNINVGTATISLIGKGNNVGGSHTITFTITPQVITRQDITDYSLNFNGVTATNFTYNGSPILPTVTYLYSATKSLTFETTTTFKYLDSTKQEVSPVEVGSYYVVTTITKAANSSYNNYTGEIELEFNIVQLNISTLQNFVVDVIDADRQIYSIVELTPTVNLYWLDEGATDLDPEKLLRINTDYIVEYANNKNAGTATITVSGMGNFTGTKTTTFVIARRDISALDVFRVSGSYSYNGRQIAPAISEISGEYANGTNTENVTFTITGYGDNINAGTSAGSINIMGTGNYTGEKIIYFEIGKLSLSDDQIANIDVVLDYSEYVYTGEEIRPQIVSIAYRVTTASEPYILYLKPTTDFTITGYTNNTNAGVASINITFVSTGNFKGTINKTFVIKPRVLDNTYFITTTSHEGKTDAPNTILSDEAYTASPIEKAEIFVYHYTVENGVYTYTLLTANVDYKLNYIDNTNAGTARIQASGLTNYTSSILTSFKITPALIANTTITVPEDISYTGMVILPSLTIVYNGITLELNKDYTVEVTSGYTNISAGTASITITGKGNFEGNYNQQFEILPKDLSNVNVVIANIEDQEYTGEPIEPNAGVVITDGTYVLVLNQDYVIDYRSNINVGATASVRITGTQNYKGEVYKTFRIVARNISNSAQDFTFNMLTTKYFTGSEITLTLSDFELLYKGEKLNDDGTDYSIKADSFTNNINAGLANFVIVGNGNYRGELAFNFNITPLPYGEGEWNIGLAEIFRYTGKPITPKPVLTANGATLVEGQDYVLSYTQNQGITHLNENGTWNPIAEDKFAIINIKFINNYSGNAIKNFGIGKIELTADDVTITLKDVVTFTGSVIHLGFDNFTMVVKATNGSEEYTLTLSDVMISNSSTTSQGEETDNLNVGTGAIKIDFGGANAIYTGSIIFDFTINKLDISNNPIYAQDDVTQDEVYTGLNIVKDLTEKLKVGDTVLVENTDFTVAFVNNLDVGTASITITGLKNLTGERTFNFNIVAKQFNETDFEIADIANQVYNYAQAIEIDERVGITFTLSDGSTRLLVHEVDYIVSRYENNINVGTATVYVKGIGNFAGEISKQFTIVAKSIVSSDLTFVTPSNRVYTGEEISLGDFIVSVNGLEDITIPNTITIYEDNIDTGVATVKFSLNNNYVGTDLTLYFNITARQYDGSTFTVPAIKEQVKTGSPIEPKYEAPYTSGPITFVNEAGHTIVLSENVDYVLGYSNNTEYGIANVDILFRGNYTGSLTRTFDITKNIATQEEFDALIYYVVKHDATDTSPARYGEVATLSDLKFVDADCQDITTISWVNGDIKITNTGTITAYVTYNPNPELYKDLFTSVTFTINKGVYLLEDVKQQLGDYLTAKFVANMKLSSITLPEYFTWQYQVANVDENSSGIYYVLQGDGSFVAVSLPTNYEAGKTYYVNDIDLSKINIGNYDYYAVTYKASYNENENCYETLKDIDVTVRIVRGDLKASNFAHTPITVTYNRNLKLSLIPTNSGYEWDTTQEGFDRLLNANGENGEVFIMNYNPKNDPEFVESVFGNKNNYNPMKVEARVYVIRANFTRAEVLRALGSFAIGNTPYKVGLKLSQINVNLPEGFSFANTDMLLNYGINKCEILYNYNSEYNPNYNCYGLNLSEKLTLDVKVVSPNLRGRLDTSNENVVESATNGIAIRRVWNSALNATGDLVPFIVEYYDDDTSSWVKVDGESTWLNGSEILTIVGYATRQVKFTAVDKNFTEGNSYGVFDVSILINGAEPDVLSLTFTDDIFDYVNSATLRYLSKVKSTNTTLQYLEDVRYMYKQIHRLGDDVYLDPDYTALDAYTILNAGEYEITAFFDSGKCAYYNFEDNYKLTKKLTITKATLNISLSPVVRTYGDLIMNNDPEVKANGIEGLNSEDYTLAVYSDSNMINRVDLSYLTNAGTYYIILKLSDSLSKNYNFGESSVFVTTYTIKQKEIPDYELVVKGVLREDGTKLNDKISVLFDSNLFVDGIIPEYELVFSKDGNLVTSIISEGTYTVSVVFTNSNYFTNKVTSFKVYEKQTYNNLIILISVIALVGLAFIIIIVAVRKTRKKNKQNVQKEQYKRAKNDLNTVQQNLNKANNANQNQQNNYNNPNANYNNQNVNGYNQNYNNAGNVNNNPQQNANYNYPNNYNNYNGNYNNAGNNNANNGNVNNGANNNGFNNNGANNNGNNQNPNYPPKK